MFNKKEQVIDITNMTMEEVNELMRKEAKRAKIKDFAIVAAGSVAVFAAFTVRAVLMSKAQNQTIEEVEN